MSFQGRVTSGISREILSAFQGLPPGGNEAGGILLGTPSGEIVLVEDFEPVLCEYRFGPSFILSDSDLRGLAESLEWFRSQPGGLRVLGFYRSQVRPDLSADDRDHALMRRFFYAPGSLFLLLKPGRGDRIMAELFVLTEAGLRPAGYPMMFPSDAWIPAAAVPAAAPAPVPAAVPAVAPPAEPAPLYEAPQAPVPFRPPETEERPSRNWMWVAVVAALTLAAAILGFLTVAPKSSSAPPQAVSKARPAPRATPPAEDPIPPVEETAPVAAGTAAAEGPTTEKSVREAIDRWERAIRSGESRQIAACYAPFVDRYLDQRNFSNEQVGKAAEESMSRYGKPSIFRVSELSLIPVSDNRAIASFRRHWQTSGPKIYAGEEQERLIFVKYGEAWKIASEELVKTYWTQPPTY